MLAKDLNTYIKPQFSFRYEVAFHFVGDPRPKNKLHRV